MRHRRRLLILLALIPASITAGAIAYWHHAPKSQPSESEDALAYVAARYMGVSGSMPIVDPPRTPTYGTNDNSAVTAGGTSAPPTSSDVPAASEPPVQVEDAPGSTSEDARNVGIEGAFAANAYGDSYGHARRWSPNGGVTGGGAPGAGSGVGSGTSGGGGADNDSKSLHLDQPLPSTDSANEHHAPDANHAPDENIDEPLAHTIPQQEVGTCQTPWCSETHHDTHDLDIKQDAYDPYSTVLDDSLGSKPRVSVPEPGSMALLGMGLLGLWANRRRRLELTAHA